MADDSSTRIPSGPTIRSIRNKTASSPSAVPSPMYSIRQEGTSWVHLGGPCSWRMTTLEAWIRTSGRSSHVMLPFVATWRRVSGWSQWGAARTSPNSVTPAKAGRLAPTSWSPIASFVGFPITTCSTRRHSTSTTSPKTASGHVPTDGRSCFSTPPSNTLACGQQGSCLPILQGNSAPKADCEINPTPSRSRSSRSAAGRRPRPGHSAALSCPVRSSDPCNDPLDRPRRHLVRPPEGQRQGFTRRSA